VEACGSRPFFFFFFFSFPFFLFPSRSGKCHGMIRSRSLTIDTSNETLAWQISVVLRSGERSTWPMFKLRHLNGSCGPGCDGTLRCNFAGLHCRNMFQKFCT
jgi:hypothetical protein